MITRDVAIDTMRKLIKRMKSSFSRWRNSKFFALKVISTTEKGDIGEDLLHALLLKAGYRDAKLSSEGRRGEWDVSCKGTKGEARFEVKVATLDTRDTHQFNEIRHDTNYTHLFLLGVAPEDMRFRLIAKEDRNKYTLTPMHKGTKAGYKLTQSPSDLHSFDCFTEEVAKVLGPP